MRKPIVDHISLKPIYQMNPPKFVYDMLRRIEQRHDIKYVMNPVNQEVINYGITAGEKQIIDLFKSGNLNPRGFSLKNEEIQKDINEGLNLVKKSKDNQDYTQESEFAETVLSGVLKTFSNYEGIWDDPSKYSNAILLACNDPDKYIFVRFSYGFKYFEIYVMEMDAGFYSDNLERYDVDVTEDEIKYGIADRAISEIKIVIDGILSDQSQLNEGLNLFKKPFPDRYFDYNTNKEFSYYEIDRHPRWYKVEYNESGKVIYKEFSDGYWEKYEYNKLGDLTYYENSDGYWEKYEYDQRGNEIYCEFWDGSWVKKEYDRFGQLKHTTYSEDTIVENRGDIGTDYIV